MPPLSVNIGIDLWIDYEETLAFLERMINRMSDMRPAWQAMHRIVLDTVRVNFSNKGRPPWAPFKSTPKEAKSLTTRIRRLAMNPTLAMWPDRAAWIADVGREGVAFQYGLNGTYSVREYTRKVTEVFGRPVSGVMARIPSHSVREHTPARPFFCFYTGDDDDGDRIRMTVKEYLFTAKANYTGLDSLDYSPVWTR